jgi:hypothetical protein
MGCAYQRQETIGKANEGPGDLIENDQLRR